MAEVASKKRTRLFSINQSSFMIETNSNHLRSDILKITNIKDIPCNIEEYDPFNTTKGIFYIKEFDFSSDLIFEDFKHGLLEMYDVKDVSLAPFI